MTDLAIEKIVLTTTFGLLRKVGACESGYKELAKSLGGVNHYGRNKPINLLTVLDSNGVEDALWCLRATEQNCEQAARLLAADFAELALPIFESKFQDDRRPRAAIEAARAFARGEITATDLESAWASARASAWAAAGAAAQAAWAAAWAATRAATRAARASAWDAAVDATRAARASAWYAAVDATRAARASALDAAVDAARAAWAAAGAAAGDKQAEIIRKYLA